jgi:transcriptional regulator with XRE-family HTH domain
MEYGRLPNYVRMHRKRMNLTERDVAFLIGLAHGSPVSRYEHFHCRPSFQTLLRLIALFDCPAQELFAGEYQEAETVVLTNVRQLKHRYGHHGKTDPSTLHKVSSLSRRLNALSEAPEEQ